MSYPILYKSTETKFDTNGIGVLSSATYCVVSEERNGPYELVLKYPINGIHFDEISDRSLIMAKPSPNAVAQPFRVYRSTSPMNGIVTFYAQHISYDLNGITVSPFNAENITQAFRMFKEKAVEDCPFSFYTDKDTVASMSVNVPSYIRGLLGGQTGSILDVYGGGEYKFDRYEVWLYQHRGTDRGVNIRYGKNLLDLEQERNISSLYTGVYPYWRNTDGEYVELPEKIVKAEGTFDFVRNKPLDLSQEWQDKPTVEQLRAKAETYVKANNIGAPKVSLTVSHVMLENTEEYKGKALLERLDLCDTASIEFTKLGVSTSAEAVKAEFNVLLDRYESITFGETKTNLADTVAAQSTEIKESAKEAQSMISKASEKINEVLQNASGLYTTEESLPDGSTITYLHDKKDLNESTNVIKITSDAIGVSTDGGKTYPYGLYINGDLVTRILSAVGIDAKWINTGILNLNLLKLAGTLCGLMQGFGSTKEGTTTEGIVIYGNGVDKDGNAKPPYLIVTSAGVRVQVTDNYSFNMSGGSFQVLGNITATKAGNAAGNITADGDAVIRGRIFFGSDGSGNILANIGGNSYRDIIRRDGTLSRAFFSDKNDETFIYGKTLYVNDDDCTTTIRGSYISSTKQIVGSSDRSLKKDIEALPAAYEKLLDGMEPVRFRYKNEPADGPFHLGYIAQDVGAALEAAGLDRGDLAALADIPQEDGGTKLGIAYGELIALLHMKINSLEAEIKQLKEDIRK